jgi:PAS domain S-box-containing protein
MKNHRIFLPDFQRYPGLTNLFNIMNIGLIKVNIRGIILDCNNIFEELTGFSKKELVNKHILKITPEKWHTQEKKIIRVARDRGYSDIFEKEYYTRSGTVIPVEIQTFMVETQGDFPIFLGVVKDISAKKETLKLFHDSEITYHELLNCTGEAVFVHDYYTHKIIDVNEAMLKMYGFTYEEAVKIDIGEISAGNAPHTIEEATELLEKAKEYGEITFEWHDRKKNGDLFWTDNTMKVLTLKGRKCIIVVSRDITERKKKQLKLQALVREGSEEISTLSEKVNLANEELKIINEELENYKNHLEELVTIRSQQLQKSEEKFSKVFHHSPCFIIVSDASNGNIIEINDAFSKRFSCSLEDVAGKSLADLGIIHKNRQKKINVLINRLGFYKNQEIVLYPGKGNHLLALASGEKVTIGKNSYIIETISDITELKKIEKQLKLTESRYANFVEQSNEGVSYIEPLQPIKISADTSEQVELILNNGILIECNDAFARLYGFHSQNDVIKKPLKSIFEAELLQDISTLFEAFIHAGYRLTDYQTVEHLKKGKSRYFIHNIIGEIHGNKLVGIWNAQRNISELKMAEESVKYISSLEQLISRISTRFFNLSPSLVDENITNAINEICNFIDADGGFMGEIFYSEKHYRLSHIWLGQHIDYDQQYFDKGRMEDLSWWINKIPEQEYFIISSLKDLSKNSPIRSVFQLNPIQSILFLPITYQGNLVGFTGYLSMKANKAWKKEDISLFRVMGEIFVASIKRKQAEEILTERERNYREIFNATTEAIFIHDARTSEVLDVNIAALKMFGFSYEDARKSTGNDYSAVELGYNHERARAYMQEALQQGQVVFEWMARRKNRENFWTEVSLKSTEIGGDMRIIAVVRDISERKKSQELLQQSEVRFRSIIQYLTDIIWIIDKNTTILYESPSSTEVLGYEPGYLIGKRGIDLVHPEDTKTVLRDLKEVFNKANDYLPTEFRARHINGQWVSLEAIANNMLDHPAIQGIIITCRDITERKHVEKALMTSEAKFRNIFNNSSDAIIIIGQDFNFLEVNEVFPKITGYSVGEIQSKKITNIITDKFLPDFAERLKLLFLGENQPALTCEVMCKTGAVIPVEINSKLIDYEGKNALVSVIRDITERRNLENRILDAIINTEEKEREKFARNLHDEMGPLLSSIKMYVNSISSTSDVRKHEFIIKQLRKIITEAIQSIKELSNDLSPHVLVNYGLLAALEWFLDQIKPYVRVTFESNLKEERYSNSIESSLYRIIKELINNTIKHAAASNIHIKLHRILKSLHLVYSDDGKGFPDGWQNKYEFMGMGMSNILSRCHSLNATCRFFNNTPIGMSFEMEIPMD